MLAIRMQRTGRKGHAMFRVVVQDSRRTPTSGKVVAYLGSYDPHAKAVVLDKDKAGSYLKHGAQPSDRVARLLKSEGVKLPVWVKLSADKERTTRNADKRRSTRPEEPEAPAEAAKPADETPVPEAAEEVVATETAEETKSEPAETAEPIAEAATDKIEAQAPETEATETVETEDSPAETEETPKTA